MNICLIFRYKRKVRREEAKDNFISDEELLGDLYHVLQKLQVVRFRSKVLSDDRIHASFQDEAVIEGCKTDIIPLVPAGLSSPGDAAVHDIIGHEVESLQYLHGPSQDVGQLYVAGLLVLDQ